MGFINWLNKKLNPNHSWTDYDENGNMTGRGFAQNLNRLLNPNHDWTDWDKYYDTRQGFTDALVKGVQQLQDPEQITSYVNGITGAHMQNVELERNDLQMQNQEDIYQRQVTGMQKAGLNPALMYQNGGASSAPTAPSGNTPGTMSDLMSLILGKKQAALLDAQRANLEADKDLKTGQAARIPVEIERMRKEIAGLDLDNASKEVINRYLDRQQRADLALKGASTEQMRAAGENLLAQIGRMDYQNALDMYRCLEVQEHISVLRSQVHLNNTQAGQLAKYASYLEKQGKILDLTAEDWDYINVVGSSSSNMKAGPFGASESRPVTLGDLKAAASARLDELDKEKKDERTWRELKDEYPE